MADLAEAGGLDGFHQGGEDVVAVAGGFLGVGEAWPRCVAICPTPSPAAAPPTLPRGERVFVIALRNCWECLTLPISLELAVVTERPLPAQTSEFTITLDQDQLVLALVTAGNGLFDATVYTVENTGEQTLVTIQIAGNHLAVKMPKEFEATTKSEVGVQFGAAAGYFFDQSDGARLRTCRLQART